MFSQSERTAHRASHYSLEGGFANIPVPYRGYATPQTPLVRNISECLQTATDLVEGVRKRKTFQISSNGNAKKF